MSSSQQVKWLAPAPASPVQPLAARPTFSIVIPAYQAAATIGQAVGSALAQTVPAHEVIVVDDGSTDDLEAALAPFGAAITLMRKANGGPASARNVAVGAATGDFIVILDADDAFNPHRLEALSELAMQRPDLDLLTTDTRFVADGQVVGSFLAHNPFEINDQRAAILRSCFVGGWPAVRLARIRAIGGFDESLRIGSDWDCWLRLILDGSRAGMITAPYYDYVLRPDAVTGNRVASLWHRVRLLEKAAANPALLPAEKPVLEDSLRRHRSQAARAQAAAALFEGGGRSGLSRILVSREIEPRTRILAAIALAIPWLGRRLISPEAPLAGRLRSAQP